MSFALSVWTPHFEWRFPLGKHFKCQSCGNCCRFPNVNLYPFDITAINAYLRSKGLDLHGLEYYDPETLRLHKADGKCVFLVDGSKKSILGYVLGNDSRGTKCFIYPARPLYCRVFPFKLVDPEKRAIELVEYDFCSGVSKGRIHKARLLELDPYAQALMDLENITVKVIRAERG